MTKKLVIRFVKFERALAMQILEQVGVTKSTNHVWVSAQPQMVLGGAYLRGLDYERNNTPCVMVFLGNNERDEYLEKVIKWISEEQFAAGGNLEIGKECEVSDNGVDWVKRKLIAVLPENYSNRYIAQVCDDKNKWTYWIYARPIASCVQPKIDGDVYTWEMEVSDER